MYASCRDSTVERVASATSPSEMTLGKDKSKAGRRAGGGLGCPKKSWVMDPPSEINVPELPNFPKYALTTKAHKYHARCYLCDLEVY